MQALTDFLRWLVTYAVSGGFWHFVAVLLVIKAIARITTLVSLEFTRNEEKR